MVLKTTVLPLNYFPPNYNHLDLLDLGFVDLGLNDFNLRSVKYDDFLVTPPEEITKATFLYKLRSRLFLEE